MVTASIGVMTSSTTTVDRGHPITTVLSSIEEELEELRDQSTWSMSPDATREAMVTATRLEARIIELHTRLVAHGRSIEVENDSGATSTANWLAHATKMTRKQAHRRSRLAHALGSDLHEPVRVAMAEGRLLVDQAEVIVKAVHELPDELDPALVRDAQAHLIDRATEFDAKALRVLAKKVLEVIAPEIGEAHEAQRLAQEERDATARARLWGRRDGHGKVRFGGELPEAYWDMLLKAVLAYTAPKHRTATNSEPLDASLPNDHRLGLGFMELIENLDPDRLPSAGGVNASVVVLLDYETLIGGLKAAQLDTGTRISPGLARRLACRAGIIPAVLGGDSEVLDLGRKRRFHTKAQRIAMAVNQRFQCAAEGCDRPASMTHAHHIRAWTDGGNTSVANGLLVCWHHHNRAHDTIYDMHRMPNGQVRFHRRT